MARTSRVGEKRHKLTCISEYREEGFWFLNCLCDCGETTTIKTPEFGKTQSCGCVRRLALGSKKHGLSDTPEYEVWSALRKRCNFDWSQAYENYGGRGIYVEQSWNNLETGFLKFLSDMGPRPSKDHSIDRIDVNGPYSKENCRWASRKEQCNNRRTNIFVEIDGETKTVSQWCEVYGKSIQMISHRVSKLGMSYEEALKTPKLKNKGKNKLKEGK